MIQCKNFGATHLVPLVFNLIATQLKWDRVAPFLFPKIMLEEEEGNVKPTIAELELHGVDYGVDDEGNRFFLWSKEEGDNRWFKITNENRVIRIK